MTDLDRLKLLFNDMGVPCSLTQPFHCRVVRPEKKKLLQALKRKDGFILGVPGTDFLFDADKKFIGVKDTYMGEFDERRPPR